MTRDTLHVVRGAYPIARVRKYEGLSMQNLHQKRREKGDVARDTYNVSRRNPLAPAAPISPRRSIRAFMSRCNDNSCEAASDTLASR